MNFWKRIFILAIGILYFSTTSVAHASTVTVGQLSILPDFSRDVKLNKVFITERACHIFLDDFEDIFFYSVNENMDSALVEMNKRTNLGFEFKENDVLACTIKTGRIKFAYAQYFVKYALSLGTILAGLVSMLFIVVGAYKYTFSGITDDLDGAKSTIRYAIIGLVVSTLSWIIVQLVLGLVTG